MDTLSPTSNRYPFHEISSFFLKLIRGYDSHLSHSSVIDHKSLEFKTRNIVFKSNESIEVIWHIETVSNTHI